eukprot:scaffold36388_cov46-Attheya_sp.AAC.5
MSLEANLRSPPSKGLTLFCGRTPPREAPKSSNKSVFIQHSLGFFTRHERSGTTYNMAFYQTTANHQHVHPSPPNHARAIILRDGYSLYLLLELPHEEGEVDFPFFHSDSLFMQRKVVPSPFWVS